MAVTKAGRLCDVSMILVGRRLDADELSRLTKDPSLTEELLDEDDDEHQDEDERPRALYLDKAWHGLHFLLTGSAWDTTDGAGEAVLGGEEIGDDVGYGPARLLRPDRVSAIAAGLRDVEGDTLRARYDAAALTAADIYPGVWDEPDVFDAYLGPYFDSLRIFYIAAADEGQAVLLAIT
jgi:Domain of unknown function (DUF1877)